MRRRKNDDSARNIAAPSDAVRPSDGLRDDLAVSEHESSRSQVRFWLLVIAAPLLLLVLYAASMGPVYGYVFANLDIYGIDTLETLNGVFSPIVWATKHSDGINGLVSEYVTWWFNVFGGNGRVQFGS